MSKFNSSLVDHYQDFFDYKKLKYEKFRSSSLITNVNTGKISLLKSYNDKMKDDLLWVIFKTDAQAKEYSRQGKSAVFITLTLDSVYHDVSSSSFISEKDFSVLYDCMSDSAYARYEEFTETFDSMDDDFLNVDEEFLFYNRSDICRDKVIKKGYKVLNDAFRRIYNKFSVNSEYQNLEYSRVIEPHKRDFTPHLHALVYVDSDLLDKFLAHVSRTISKLQNSSQLGKQFDIQVLDSTQKASGYLVKYIRKSFENEFVKGYYLKHKIRAFLTSRDILPRYVFDLVKGRIKVEYEDEDVSYIEAHLQACKILILDENGDYIRSFGNDFSDVLVKITREKVSPIFSYTTYFKIIDFTIENAETLLYRKDQYVFERF